jgi:protein-S-isoprenylcysteine O-methyltransferase Ste14
MNSILLFALLFTGAMAAYVLEEFVLIKPTSTIGQSDPVSRRLELAALWVPAGGIGLTGMTLWPLAGVRGAGVVNAMGGVLCAAGLTLRYVSRKTLGRFFTIGVVKQEGHTVVQNGPYRHLRHPGYFGFVLFYLGLPLLVGNWLGLAVLSLPALVVLILLVGVEDRQLAEKLGEPYREYQRRTARLFPGLW